MLGGGLWGGLSDAFLACVVCSGMARMDGEGGVGLFGGGVVILDVYILDECFPESLFLREDSFLHIFRPRLSLLSALLLFALTPFPPFEIAKFENKLACRVLFLLIRREMLRSGLPSLWKLHGKEKAPSPPERALV